MPGPDDPIYHATLWPHRSLTRRQARRIIIATSCVTAALSVPFYVMGAWPVIGFLGLDVIGLGAAFALSFRSARAHEDVEVTPIEVVVAKVTPGGRRREWRFNPAWVRLNRREHADYGLLRLALASRGRELEVGQFLGPDARADVARDLSHALSEARRGPRFDTSPASL